MKKLMIVGLAAVVGGLGCYWVSREYGTNRSHKSYKSHPPDPPTTTLSDPSEVFQKAFWKRPTANDKILHSERRQWADATGVKRWQWFIEVEPSPGLVKYLREDNAFSLVPATTVPPISDAPGWFKFQPAEFDVLQASQGKMRLFFSKTKPLLFATDSGGGFHSGVPEPAQPEQSPATASGRIPLTSPPLSR